ncbi:MAG TPA: glycine oxidase ThiO [Vicinamibacterales bacterium]
MASPREIVVVGAGVVGCAIAYELSRRGASVIVIDDRAPGMGATQASAGVLAPFIEARNDGSLVELTARSLGLFDAFVSRVRSDSQATVAYQRSGTLDVALDADSLTTLQKTHAWLDARGVESNLLDARGAIDCEPQLSSSVTGGLLIPAHGFVGASQLTHALTTAALRKGARFVDYGRVASLTRDGAGLRLDTSGTLRKVVRADAVVLAAGSWSGAVQIDGVEKRLPVRPIRGQLLHLHWTGAENLRRVVWSDRCYVVPWQDGTVLVGATEEDAGFDERTTLAGIQDLIDAACELLPHAWTASLIAAKVGLRPGTPDHIPIIGWSEAIPNLMYATGHYRNGILLAPLTAELVADAILEKRSDPLLELTRPQRFGQL